MDENEITIRKLAQTIAHLMDEMKATRESMQRSQQIIEEKRAELHAWEEQTRMENRRKIALAMVNGPVEYGDKTGTLEDRSGKFTEPEKNVVPEVLETKYGTFKITARAEKYPIIFRYLCGMGGVSRSERLECLDDFEEADISAFTDANEIDATGSIRDFFVWEEMPAGRIFWESIYKKATKP